MNLNDALNELKNTERGFTTEEAKNDARWNLLSRVLRQMCEAQGMDMNYDMEKSDAILDAVFTPLAK